MSTFTDYVVGTLALAIVILLAALVLSGDLPSMKAPAQIQYEACVKTAEDLGLTSIEQLCWLGAFDLK